MTTRTVLNISVAASHTAAAIGLPEFLLAELTCFLPFFVAVRVVLAVLRTPPEQPPPRTNQALETLDRVSFPWLPSVGRERQRRTWTRPYSGRPPSHSHVHCRGRHRGCVRRGRRCKIRARHRSQGGRPRGV